MPDVLDHNQRYRSMVHNRGRTGPERRLASALWQLGLRYLTPEGYKTRYGRRLPGSPDLVFPKKRIVVFVDGCFWHGCQECKGVPHQSGDFWRRKIEENLARDNRVDAELKEAGWMVIRVPEHAVKAKRKLGETAKSLAERLSSWVATQELHDRG